MLLVPLLLRGSGAMRKMRRRGAGPANGESYASIRVQVRELRQGPRGDADPHGARERKGQMPQLRKREGHPSARGVHSQDLAEELKAKGVLWQSGLVRSSSQARTTQLMLIPQADR